MPSKDIDNLAPDAMAFGGPGGASHAARVLVILLFTIAALFGATMISFSLLAPAVHSLRAINWVETPCVILNSEIVEVEREGRKLYGLEMVYEYRFDGVGYVSRNYQIVNRLARDYRPLEKIIARYPPLTQSICYVNPKAPDESALDRGLPAGLRAYWLLSAALLITGVAGLIRSARAAMKRRAPKEEPEFPWIPRPPEAVERVMPEGERGFLPQSSYRPGRSFFYALGLFLAWTLMLVILTLVWLRRMNDGAEAHPFVLILIPLAGIGLIHLGILIISIVKLRKPRMRFIVSALRARPGDEITVWWRSSGESAGDEARILLERYEEVITPLSEFMRSDPFERIEIAHLINRLDMQAGRASFRIPDSAIHSFSAPHNRLVWQLRAENPDGGDIGNRCELVILPPMVEEEGE